MTDIFLESLRFIFTGLIVFFLIFRRGASAVGNNRGWKFLTAGFCLIFFGTLIDITDNFESLNRFLVIGDTPYQAFLEKVVGYLFGFLFLAVGVWLWLPSVIAQEAHMSRQVAKAREEIKVLSGLLPICASCKKIRDDKGYWSEIESYIHNHSEAHFSHSVCPDCKKKIYADTRHQALELGRGHRPASPQATLRRYLKDDHCVEADARVVAVQGDAAAFDQTCFYPGGGGQPSDTGLLRLPQGEEIGIESAREDPDGIIWHKCRPALPPDALGHPVRLIVDKERRAVLSRYHTALHVLNTIVLRDCGGMITGVQIAEDHARIDFKLEGFSVQMAADLEEKVNAVLAGGHLLKSRYLTEEEFHRRGDLIRTLTVQPPVLHGHVRVVEIEGFDAQACGGTHVHSTDEVGRFSITRTENKGKNNKRFYVRLEPFAGPSGGSEPAGMPESHSG